MVPRSAGKDIASWSSTISGLFLGEEDAKALQSVIACWRVKENFKLGDSVKYPSLLMWIGGLGLPDKKSMVMEVLLMERLENSRLTCRWLALATPHSTQP